MRKSFYLTIPVGDVLCQVILEIVEVDESGKGGKDQESRVEVDER